MKHLKPLKINEISSPAGSIEVDIANLSPTARYNNANPAIELEEELDDTMLLIVDNKISFDLHLSTSLSSYDILDDIKTYLEEKYSDSISNIKTDSGGFID